MSQMVQLLETTCKMAKLSCTQKPQINPIDP